ncbi:MAG: hypothetical protein A2511_09045 [Deltaproteobacteria bacterium RIFOXYD12_FULL_50_9]|nr:MAG: hypothetical protein A2511_09045 [Deltaproteobacteria bacterium RIFOXYD12_FULL_50_9]
MQLPCIAAFAIESGFESCCAIRVASLLAGHLLLEAYYGAAPETNDSLSFSKLNHRHLQNSRENLLTALAPMTNAVFEIRVLVIPDLLYKAQGNIDIYIVIRCHGAAADIARETAATTFFDVFAVLASCLPEADLKPVKNLAELEQCLKPFKVEYACAVMHRQREISLTSIVEQPSAIGFLRCESKEEEPTLANRALHILPWTPSYDDWGRLIEIMTGQLNPTMLLIRLRPRENVTAEKARISETITLCETALAGMAANKLTLKKQVSLLNDQSIFLLEALETPCFDIAALIISSKPVPAPLQHAVGTAISGNRPKGDEDAWLQGGFSTRSVDADNVLAAEYFPELMPFNLVEAACAFRLPSPPNRDIPGLPIQRFRTSLAMLPPELDEKPSSIKLFINEYQGMTQPVFVNPDDRMRHCFIMGQTGTGKSTLMKSLILQDIRAGRGVAVIDPHGDMIDNILGRIPRERADDIILFDFLDRERPLGFNMIQWRDLAERDLIIDELYRTLDHVYDMKETGGPIFEQHFRNFLKLLMGDKPDEHFTPTLLEFVRCYSDKEFRHWLLKRTSDEQVREFVEEAEATSGDISMRNISPYITSKFGRFVNDTTLKRIIGQSESSINFDDIMDQGKIFLVNIGKGRFGSAVAALLSNMLVARFKFSAMQRGEVRKEDRRDFFLYVDEAHNLPQDNLSELLAEARKYRLGLVLATQYCSQLGSTAGLRGDDLLSAIFGNVGTLITFRTGSQDAELLAKGFEPYFNHLDIMSLPNFQGYTRVNLNNQGIIPFSFRTEPDTIPGDETLARSYRTLSRLKYGQDAVIVDSNIRRRMKSWKTLS